MNWTRVRVLMGLSRLRPDPGPHQAPGCPAQKSPQCSARHDKETQTRTKNPKEWCRWNYIVCFYLYFNEGILSLVFFFFLISSWYEWVNRCVGGKNTFGGLLKLSCKWIQVEVFGVENKIIQKHNSWVCPNHPLCFSSGGELGHLRNREYAGNKC